MSANGADRQTSAQGQTAKWLAGKQMSVKRPEPAPGSPNLRVVEVPAADIQLWLRAYEPVA
jgi:hypothetical protein